jgi:hypothetical protein
MPRPVPRRPPPRGAVLRAARRPPPAFAAGWTIAPAPPTGQNAYLHGIAAHTDTDAWAVGTVGVASRTVTSLPLIDHWNGTAWSQATAPTFPATESVHLYAVSASSATDAWAVGSDNPDRDYSSALTLHWNASAWTTVANVLSFQSNSSLLGVADISSTDAYAVGDNAAGGLAEQWNGTAWTSVSPPFPMPNGVTLPENTIGAISDYLCRSRLSRPGPARTSLVTPKSWCARMTLDA